MKANHEAPPRHPIVHTIDRTIVWASEVPAAILVARLVVIAVVLEIIWPAWNTSIRSGTSAPPHSKSAMACASLALLSVPLFVFLGRLIALLSSSGAMSETIAPSLVLISIGSVTGVSIAALFTGGLLPALVGALALCVVVWFHNRNEDLSSVVSADRKNALKTFIVALPRW